MGSGVGSGEKDVEQSVVVKDVEQSVVVKDVEQSVVVCLCNQYDSLCSRLPKQFVELIVFALCASGSRQV